MPSPGAPGHCREGLLFDPCPISAQAAVMATGKHSGDRMWPHLKNTVLLYIQHYPEKMQEYFTFMCTSTFGILQYYKVLLSSILMTQRSAEIKTSNHLKERLFIVKKVKKYTMNLLSKLLR